MKKVFILSLLSIFLGVLLTTTILNKRIFAKEDYFVYVLEAGSYANMKDANKLKEDLQGGIIIRDNNLYRVYVGIYKNSDVVNKMIVYFENKGINVYLKSLEVESSFYTILDKYEQIILNNPGDDVYDKVNEAILELYKESIGL